MHSLKHTLCFAFFGFLFVCPGQISAAEEKSPVDPSGVWRWEHDEEGETIQDVLKLTYADSKLTGSYTGRVGPYKIENGKVEGDSVSFDFNVEINDREIHVEFEGDVSKDEIDGYIYLDFDGQTESYPWTAKRGLKEEDVVGTWKLAIETDSGSLLEPSLSLSWDEGEFMGKLSMPDLVVDMKVSDIKVKDHHLYLTIMGDVDGAPLKSTYKLKPQGDKVSGILEYDFAGSTGELDVNGKRNAK